jgi:hypothetical protein
MSKNHACPEIQASAKRRREVSNPRESSLETVPLPKLADKELFSGTGNKESRPDRFPDGRLLRPDESLRHGGEPVPPSLACSVQDEGLPWSFDEHTAMIAAARYWRCVPRSRMFVMTAPVIVGV